MRFPSARARFVIQAICVGALAAACAKKQPVEITASIPSDYRDRHPIIVGPAETGVDIFMRGAQGLDLRQRLDVKAAADDFRANGQGRMTILTPVGPHGAPHRGVAAVRSALASAGVSGVAQAPYRVEGPPTDQPIRLVYTKLQARVATKCGQWPRDIAGFQGVQSWSNESYYNYGCATQNALAQQIADPMDLVHGRTETPISSDRRLGAIGKYWKGEDPSTNYRIQTQSGGINATVGRN